MVKGIYLKQGDDLSVPLAIREEVFVREQGVPPEEEYDTRDPLAVHALVYDEAGRPAGTARLLLNEDGTFHIGRVAVLAAQRHKGYGDFLVRMLLDRAFRCGAQEVHLGAQLQAIPFYETIGFTVYGEEYLDAGIRHRPMRVRKGEVKTACGHCH